MVAGMLVIRLPVDQAGFALAWANCSFSPSSTCWLYGFVMAKAM